MSRLEVDVKSIQNLIRSRAVKARKSLGYFESRAEKLVKVLVQKGLKSQKEGKKQVEQLLRDVQKTLKTSPLVKNLKNTTVYHTALEAKDRLEKRVAQAQEKVFEMLQVPTKQDLDRLNSKIESLNRRFHARVNDPKKKSAPQEEKK